MAPAAVIEKLEIFKNGGAGLGTTSPLNLINEFELETGEKTLGDRVVPAITAPAHTATKTVFGSSQRCCANISAATGKARWIPAPATPALNRFLDNDISRRTFFGRGQSSIALTDQILANRLVVVYAKSGVGKTSLLNAGIAPRLREAGVLPLSVRVNDPQRGPLISVLEGIRADAERQQVEYVPGESGSLWTFFKSVEFWREDLLLAPVLILDQFEELFTLQPEQARETFLSELGALIRGVPPPSQSPVDSGANVPPRFVWSSPYAKISWESSRKQQTTSRKSWITVSG